MFYQKRIPNSHEILDLLEQFCNYLFVNKILSTKICLKKLGSKEITKGFWNFKSSVIVRRKTLNII